MIEFVSITLPDGRLATVFSLAFGRARLGVSPKGEWSYFEDEW